MDGDLNGLPPQVTVRTRSFRNQISISSSCADIGAATIPLATPARDAKAGSSTARLDVEKTPFSSLGPTQRAISRISSVPGTSPVVVTSSSKRSAAPLAPSGKSKGRERSNSAPRQSPSRETNSIIRCSSRRAASSP